MGRERQPVENRSILSVSDNGRKLFHGKVVLNIWFRFRAERIFCLTIFSASPLSISSAMISLLRDTVFRLMPSIPETSSSRYRSGKARKATRSPAHNDLRCCRCGRSVPAEGKRTALHQGRCDHKRRGRNKCRPLSQADGTAG